ncbi:hypothetical protein RUM43_013894 [Polyplax serrata]|uniref:G-protein coupled receptors family 1 profile domain-containing protein n=1 Tax=Polyplax serrata TaxID=468196 RepID=A0AAN8RY64_POLSC
MIFEKTTCLNVKCVILYFGTREQSASESVQLVSHSSIRIVIIFAVSWLPLGCFSLLADLEGYSGVVSSENLQISIERIYTGLAIVHVIAMSSAISNPIVYGWMNSNIRHEFLQLLPFRCGQNTREKEGRATEGIENDTTRTQIHYNYPENTETVTPKECATLLVTLNETSNSIPESGNAESL